MGEIHAALGHLSGLSPLLSQSNIENDPAVVAGKAAAAEKHRLWLERAAIDADAIADQEEKIVRVVSACTSLARGGYRSIEFAIDVAGLQRLLPELFPPDAVVSLNYPPPWSHAAIQSWFGDAVRSSVTHPNLAVSTQGFFGPKERRIRAWGFAHGSTRSHTSKDGYSSFAPIFIAEDGRRLYSPPSGGCSSDPLSPNEGFNAYALSQMARLARLPALGGEDSAT